jgi:outer membrane protein assembly factor BamB
MSRRGSACGRGSRGRRGALRLAGALAVGIAAALGACSPAGDEADPFAFAMDPDTLPDTPHGQIGYRIDWKGYTATSSRRAPKHFEVFGDTLVAHDQRNIVSVMDARTGKNRWNASVGHRLERFVGNARWFDRLVVPSETEVYVFDINTGSLEARHRLAALANTPPAVVGNFAVFGCTSGELVAHDLAAGFKGWGYLTRGAIRQRPVKLGDIDVGSVSEEGAIIIVDVRTGSARGRSAQIYGGVATEPVGDGRTLYVASRDQSLWAYRVEDGALRWRVRTQNPITAQPTLHGGTLYVTLVESGLTAFSGRSGDRLWSNEEVRGEAIAMLDRDLLVWTGSSFQVVEADTGVLVREVDFPDTLAIATDGFEDAIIYAIGRGGEVRRYSPSVR